MLSGWETALPETDGVRPLGRAVACRLNFRQPERCYRKWMPVAAGQAANVSAFVQHSVGVALHDAAGWKEMLEDALQQTGGPLTKNERAWADALLFPQERRRGPKKGRAA